MAIVEPLIEPFELWDVRDVFSIEPPRYLMDYWLLDSGRTVIWGKYGSGKSLLLLEWGIHLALGQNWNEYDVPKPVRVLYIYAEGASDLQKRLGAWVEAHGFGTLDKLREELDGRLMFVDVDPNLPDINLRDEHTVKRMIKTVELFDPAIIFFDPLAKLWPGLDNNEEKEVGSVLKTIDDIRQGRAAVLATHARKDQGTYRGVTTLPDLTDVVASMTKEIDGTVKLEISPNGDGHKHKFREPRVQKYFMLQKVSIGPHIDPQLEEDEAVYLKHLSGTPAALLDLGEQIIVQFLPGTEYTPKQIKEALGLPSGSQDSTHVNRKLTEMAEGGFIESAGKGKYRITDKGERWANTLLAPSVSAAESPSGTLPEDTGLDDYAA